MPNNFSLNEYLVIDTTGSIGIGTTNPGARLHVTGSNTITNQPTAIFKAGSSAQVGGVGIFDVQNSAGASLFFVSGSGNVGIGTNTPIIALDVFSANPQLRLRGTGTTTETRVIASFGGAALAAVGTVDSNPLMLMTSNTERMRFDTSGNVGIGITNPSVRLDIASGSMRGYYYTSTYDGELLAGADAGGYYFATGFGKNTAIPILIGSNATNIIMSAGGSERLRIVGSSGNVGIGTATPSTVFTRMLTLHNAGSAGISFSSTNHYAIGANGNLLQFYDVTSAATRAIIDVTGNFGIGNSTTASARFQVSGSSTASTPTAVIREGVASPTGGVGVLDVQNSAGTSILFITGSQRVGIGTASPAERFHVNAGSSVPVRLVSSGFSGIEYHNTEGTPKLYIGTETGGGGARYNSLDSQHTFYNSGVNVLRINSSGNIAPGTDNAQDLGSTTLRWRNVYAASMSGSLTGSNVLAGQVVVAGTGGVLSGSNDFWWDNTNRRVGIGTNSVAGFGRTLQIHNSAGQSEIKLTNNTTGATAMDGSIIAQVGNQLQIYNLENDIVQLGTNNTERVRIDASGNVGIGTTSYTARLFVSGSSTATTSTAVIREGVVSPTAGVGVLDVQNSAGTSILFVSGSGNVGIGTTVPLAVSGYTSLTLNNPSTGGLLVLQSNGTAQGYAFVNGTSYTMQALGSTIPIRFIVNGSERVRFDTSGNVGIGTTSPAQTLEIQNGSNYHIRLGNSSANTAFTYDIGRSTATGELRFYGNQNNANGYIFDGVNGERLRINTVGNVGIGTSIYTARLFVSGSSTSTTPVLVARGGVSNASGALLDIQDSNATTQLVVSSSGNVGIGTGLPSGKFEVVGTSGSLLLITDSLSGSLFSVNDITGLPILEVFSDDRLVAGAINSNALVVTGSLVGIGVSTPTARLFVSGTSVSSQPDMVVREGVPNPTGGAGIFDVQNSVGTSILFVSGSGNVGIGTASPTFRLQLGNNTSTGTAAPETISLGGTYSNSAGSNLKLRLYNDGASVYGLGVSGGQLDYAVAAGANHVWYIGGSERVRIDTSGNVGIGISGIADRLAVNGTMSITGSYLNPGVNNSTALGSTSKSWSNVVSTAFSGSLTRLSDGTTPYLLAGSNVTLTTGSNGQITVAASLPGGSVSGTGTTNYITKWTGTSTVGNSVMVDDGTNVGIGTAFPTARLSIFGSTNAAASVIYARENQPASSEGVGVLRLQNSNGDDLLFVSGSGNVGIGTSTLLARLHVTGSSTASAQTVLIRGGTPSQTGPVLEVEDYLGSTLLVVSGSGNVGIGTIVPGAILHTLTTGNTTGIFASTASRGWVELRRSTSTTLGYIGTGGGLITGAADADLAFRCESGNILFSSVATERVRIDTSGNVGINTTSMSLKLEVSGSDARIHDVRIGRGPGSTISNTLVGGNAGGALGSGAIYATIVGAYAGNSVSTGNYNTLMGTQAGGSISTASNNTYVGANAGYRQSGGDNTAVGRDALIGGVGASATANTAIGFYAGQSITTGGNNFFGGYQAGYSTTTGASNVALGALSLYSVSVGNYNVGAGYQAGYGITSGSNNVTLGYQSGYNTTTGAQNILIGTVSGFRITTANYNTHVGGNAGVYNSASGNSSLGYQALAGVDGSSTGANNVAIGYQAAYGSTTGFENVVIGYIAGYSTTTAGRNVVIGSAAGNAISTGGANVAIGYAASYRLTTGTQTVSVGSGASAWNTGSDNTAVGFQALYGISGLSSAGGNTALGSSAGYSLTTGTRNLFAGYQAGLSNSVGNYNVMLGNLAGYATTSGSSNIAVGSGAAYALTTGNYNTVVGDSAGYEFTTASSNTYLGRYSGIRQLGSNNVGVGAESLNGTTTTSTASNNTAVGYRSGYAVTTGAGNVTLGYRSGYALTTGAANVYIGNDVAFQNSTGTRNVIIGDTAGNRGAPSDVTLIGYRAGIFASGINNTALGSYALYGADGQSTATNNVAVGYQAGYVVTTGGNNFFGGHQAGFSQSVATQNVYVGAFAGYLTTSGSNNVAVGYNAGYSETTGTQNVWIGASAGQNQTAKSRNVVIGFNAGVNALLGNDNVIVGRAAVDNGYTDASVIIGVTAARNVTGNNNVAVGANALQGAVGSTSAASVAVGYQSLYSTTTSSNNTATGYQSGFSVTSGGSNTFMGYRAGYVTSVGSNNTFIGNQAGVAVTSGSNNTFIGNTAGQSATLGDNNVFLGFGAGNTLTTGTNNIYLGVNTVGSGVANTNETVIGFTATGRGSNTTTIGNGSITLTLIPSGSLASGGTATGTSSVSLGSGNTASGNYSVSLGQNNSSTNNSSFSAGFANGATNTYATSIGSYNTASGANSLAVGTANTANNTAAVAIGNSNTASGISSVAMGQYSLASGAQSVAIGSYVTGSNTGAIAMGTNNTSSGPYSVAMGLNNTVSGQSAVAIGQGIGITREYSAGFGVSQSITGPQSITAGFGNSVSGANSAAFGTFNTASGASTFVAGQFSLASGAQAIAMGNAATGSFPGAVAIGSGSLASSTEALVFGARNTASGPNAIAIGNNSTASFTGSISIGAFNTASGQSAAAIGGSNTASGGYGFAAGYNSTASGFGSIAMGGGGNVANTAFAMAFGSTNTSSGVSAIAMGQYSLASGAQSVAIGSYVTGSNTSAVAMGASSVASGQNSVSIGTSNTANAQLSTALGGISNTASGVYAVAVGAYNLASGASSFVSGLQTTAYLNGQRSHSAGYFAAGGDAQISTLVARNSTTNASATELFLNAGATLRAVLPASTTWDADITVVARASTGTSHASFRRRCLISRNASNTTALVGSVQVVGSDIGSNVGSPPAGWAVTVSADDTNESLKIEVTGAVSTNIRWVARIELVEVGY